MTHDDFLNLATELAKESGAIGRFPFGAVIVKDRQVVGDSRHKPDRQHLPPLDHAEIRAIIDARENLGTGNLSGCVIYASCQPCSMCMGAIKWAGIKEVYYAMDKSDADSIGHLNNIFWDDFISVNENKISDYDFLEYMKDWYNKTLK